MMQPKYYVADCLRYVGRVLLHEPWPSADMHKDYEDTLNIWEKEYDQNMETNQYTSKSHLKVERLQLYYDEMKRGMTIVRNK
jgi:hypothetical protein